MCHIRILRNNRLIKTVQMLKKYLHTARNSKYLPTAVEKELRIETRATLPRLHNFPGGEKNQHGRVDPAFDRPAKNVQESIARNAPSITGMRQLL